MRNDVDTLLQVVLYSKATASNCGATRKSNLQRVYSCLHLRLLGCPTTSYNANSLSAGIGAFPYVS